VGTVGGRRKGKVARISTLTLALTFTLALTLTSGLRSPVIFE
jgi:hypothetical protein